MSETQNASIHHAIPREEAIQKGYLPGIYKEDTPWSYEADIWHQLYYSFCDNRMDRANRAFEWQEENLLEMSAENLHQENRKWIFEEFRRPDCWTVESLMEAFSDNPVIQELITECAKEQPI